MSQPTLDQFLACPAEAVAAVAPQGVIFAAGGTRRSAALSGVAPDSTDYVRLSRERMVDCFARFYRLGVRHLYTSLLRPGQIDEVGPYREQLMRWVVWGLTGPEALADYRRHGWRVRLIGAGGLPELEEAAHTLVEATPDTGGPTLWFHAAATRSALWQMMLATALAGQARTQAELIRAIYGEDVPPARLQIGFGKPLVTNDIVPLLLYEETQCYWVQRPGYDLDELMIRRIIYDSIYLRSTWVQDKSSRYAEISEHQALWESRAVLGVGRRVGGFWYPDHGQEVEP
ncbi:MAG: hypothetical protein HGA45_00295 [Chloroflexales bacterium]|nr:hypothetical protein [Chloroflexales bacterium]